MEKSLFAIWVTKWFVGIATKVTESINGMKSGPTYLHITMLKKEYTPTLKFASLNSNGTIVAADVVAFDSSLPLKKRDVISKTEGDVPKLGMKISMNERTLTDLGILRKVGGKDAEIVTKLFEDTKKCIYGIKEQLEFMFLQAVSTGMTSISKENNSGVEIRIDFMHPAANKFGVNLGWTNAAAKPVDDIDNVLDAASANGDSISTIMMDKATFNRFKNNDQVKQLHASNVNFNGTNVATPTLAQINEAMFAHYGINIIVIDRTVVFEKNSVRTKVKPWAENSVVFVTTLELGTLTYGTLAEEENPAKNVDYVKVDDFILVSKYHKVDPLQEFTSSQALVLPVLNGIESIYILDSEEWTSDLQVEGGTTFTYNGLAYTTVSVIDAINLADAAANAVSTNTDATLLKKINRLSDDQISVFEANIVLSV